MSRQDSLFKRSTLFSPEILRRLVEGTGHTSKQIGAQLSSSNIGSTGSFRYDSPSMSGIKSTQQIPVDWSDFTNHTFFNSAESKVNVAFDKIINTYPFDGNKKEHEEFFDELIGFEKHVYDKFPKYMGFLHFSGTSISEYPGGPDAYPARLGTYITVNDAAGAFKPVLSKDKSGRITIGPAENQSISFEMQLFIPEGANHNQVILQKREDDNNALTVCLKADDSTTSCRLAMIVSSGSNITNQPYVITASMGVDKNRFSHICAVLDRTSGINNIKLYQSGVLFITSTLAFNFRKFGFYASEMTLGSGSQHRSSSIIMHGGESGGGAGDFTPNQTFSGAIDEFRVFHEVRPQFKQQANQFKNIFPSSKLVLYYRFNEVTGTYPNNSLVLDSSGHSLHKRIENFTPALRDKTMGREVTQSSPLKNERSDINPVLFPLSQEVMNLNTNLLYSASLYDANNPNLITKLIPRHYLLEAQWAQGFEKEDGNIGQAYSTGSFDFPGGGVLGSPQIISLILMLWAKYFDELKMFTDQFSKLLWVDYYKDDRVADQFLTFVGDYYGFSLPNFYSLATSKQYLEGENLLADPSYSKYSLRYVQNQLWRRILASLQGIIRSKGTVHSVKALIRAMGLNPDNNFRFREFGGAKSKVILETRRLKSEMAAMLDFSGSLNEVTDPEDLNPQGFHAELPYIMSPFFTGSRIEAGFPTIAGTFVRKDLYPPHGASDDRNDGLFTSGSFTYEGIYRFTTPSGSNKHFVSQSLMRLHVTASENDRNAYTQGVVGNLLALSESLEHYRTGSIHLYVRPGVRVTSPVIPTLHLMLTGVNIFDGNHWHISWGRHCREELNSINSSSYFLRAARQNYGEIFRYYATSSLFYEWSNGAPIATRWSHDTFTALGSQWNTSGTFIVIGSQSLESTAAGEYLNDETNVDEFARATGFSGKVGQLRFWSKALTTRESKEHTVNFKSIGVEKPLTNFNFTKPFYLHSGHTSAASWEVASGSRNVCANSGTFERIRLDVSTDQPVTRSDGAGQITLTDTTQYFTSGTRGAPWVLQRQNHMINGLLFVMSGTGFETSRRIIKPEQFYYSYIDPKFDERSAFNKIRIRSWQQRKNIDDFDGSPVPTYDVLKSEEPEDDTRFLIESSFVQALNEDIIKIFGTLDELNNVFGDPELLFSDNYPDLRILRDLYFNRLTRRIKVKEFFEFFKWFDDSIGVILERLMPKKTDFLGVQFTIESHMLERTKFRYNYADNYIPPHFWANTWQSWGFEFDNIEFYPGDGGGETIDVWLLPMGMWQKGTI